MANERGMLPKASREELDDRLRRRLARWFENAYEDDNLFLTMARRPGLLDATWGFIRYIYGGEPRASSPSSSSSAASASPTTTSAGIEAR